MRRILLGLAVAALMAAMLVASAMPAFAQAEVIKPPEVKCFQDNPSGRVDTSENCLVVRSPSGNETLVNRNPEGPKFPGGAFVTKDTTNCTLSGEQCDKSIFTATPSGKDIQVAHLQPKDEPAP